MQENLRLRVPALEWSVLEGRGELGGLTWVDSNIDVEQEPFSVLNILILLCNRIFYPMSLIRINTSKTFSR